VDSAVHRDPIWLWISDSAGALGAGLDAAGHRYLLRTRHTRSGCSRTAIHRSLTVSGSGSAAFALAL
jgi:hypothetical protein